MCYKGNNSYYSNSNDSYSINSSNNSYYINCNNSYSINSSNNSCSIIIIVITPPRRVSEGSGLLGLGAYRGLLLRRLLL